MAKTVNVSLSCCFGCPMEGDVPQTEVLAWVQRFADLGVEGKIVEVSHEEVQQIGNAAQPLMTKIMMELVAEITAP